MTKENQTSDKAQQINNSEKGMEQKPKMRKRRDYKRLAFSFLFLCIAVFFLFYNTSSSKKSYQQIEGLAFGTEFHVTYCHPDGKDLTTSIYNALDDVNSSLSMFDKNSLLYRINKGEIVETDSLFRKVWAAGSSISKASDGAFDMTVAPLVNAWGFGFKNRCKLDSTMVDSLLQYVGWNKISWIDNYIVLPEGMQIDAGAIAKGFGCDVVADSLRANGATDFCVEIGGEITVLGKNSKGKLWRIGINEPEDDSLAINRNIYKITELDNCGMATSGNYRRFYIEDGVKYSHTINPKTGWPVKHSLLSATIIAENCMIADGWATACMVVGLEGAKQLIEGQGLQGFLIYEENGEIKSWHSEGFPIID